MLQAGAAPSWLSPTEDRRGFGNKGKEVGFFPVLRGRPGKQGHNPDGVNRTAKDLCCPITEGTDQSRGPQPAGIRHPTAGQAGVLEMEGKLLKGLGEGPALEEKGEAGRGV